MNESNKITNYKELYEKVSFIVIQLKKLKKKSINDFKNERK